MTASLIRIRSAPDVSIYAVADSAEVVNLLAGTIAAGGDADTMPWSALPGLQAAAAHELVRSGRRKVVFLGTVVSGAWATWHPPGDPPAVPLADSRNEETKEG